MVDTQSRYSDALVGARQKDIGFVRFKILSAVLVRIHYKMHRCNGMPVFHERVGVGRAILPPTTILSFVHHLLITKVAPINITQLLLFVSTKWM